jgi:hypothetical protein
VELEPLPPLEADILWEDDVTELFFDSWMLEDLVPTEFDDTCEAELEYVLLTRRDDELDRPCDGADDIFDEAVDEPEPRGRLEDSLENVGVVLLLWDALETG